MKHILNVLLLLAILPIFSQNKLEGKVVDSNSQLPIQRANIYFPQLEKGTSTKDNGSFSISNIPNGTHKVIVSYLGYETISINVNFPFSEEFNIEMISSAIEMEGIIVSTPFHKLQSENVMKVEQKKISDLNAEGAINLTNGISNFTGVESISTGLGIGKPVIRGLSANRVLVYTQGVRLENQQYGDEHGLGLNSAGIESIEVIKGPASLLYGSDALGGVLYLNPEKFAQSNITNADFSANYFSNTQGYNSNAGIKHSTNNFKFLFRGSTAQHTDYKTRDYHVINTRFLEKDFKAGLGYQITNFKTELRYNVNHSNIGIPEEIGEQSTIVTPLEPFQEITNHVMSSKSTFFFNDSKLNLNFGLTYNDRKEFEEHHHDEHEEDDDHDDEEEEHDDEEHDEHEEEDEEVALHMKLKTFNYDIKYHLPELGKFETIVGIQGLTQSNTNYGEELLIPNANVNDIGFFATSHIHFNNVDIQLGARYDNRNISVDSGLDKNFNSFNGAIGIRTNLSDNFIARINLATGFRAPNLAELTSDGVHHGTNRYEIGNENLKSEQNFQTDIALEYQTEHVEFFANGFYNLINDYIFLSPNGNEIDQSPVFLYLQDNAKLYGGEFGFHLHPHPLDWLHFESSFETVIGKQNNDEFLPLIPANSWTNILRGEFEFGSIKKGYAFIKYKSTSSQDKVSTFETTTDGYGLLSAGFGGSFNLFNNELNVSISGTNLTNNTYIHHLSRLKTDGIFNIGRNIKIGITYNL
ncbi:TonB-dependent receptor [Seonamhaeicola sp. MEBiC1930]|uniref:TonB-dependent receptor n=1 Tax=Seonamhaeicola sp. MEBiC01930 TaxID=2976768 RepID=UPI0032531CFB